jgi:hypothetical protein
MHDRRSPLSVIALLVILGAIAAGAFATQTFDEVYFGPICQRHADATQTEFVLVSGGYRRAPLHCVFNQYFENGQLQARVEVPLSRIQKAPIEHLFGLLRWAILVGFVLPSVWLAQRLVRHYD